MAKGKTQFSCVEKRIHRGKWRWAVSYLGECLGYGIVKNQDACRVEKDRVKAEFLARHGEKAISDPVVGLAGRFINRSGKFNSFVLLDSRRENTVASI